MPDTRPAMHPDAHTTATAFKSEVVTEVADLIAAHDVVVVGMGWNPHVKRVRRALESGGVAAEYHEIGNYCGKWNQRLAIKLWSGWPTFPQVFVKGTLIGGADHVETMLASGEISTLLSA